MKCPNGTQVIVGSQLDDKFFLFVLPIFGISYKYAPSDHVFLIDQMVTNSFNIIL